MHCTTKSRRLRNNEEKSKYSLYFDPQSAQDQYAKCCEFISVLYKSTPVEEKHNRLAQIRELAEEIHISGAFIPNMVPKYYEQPMNLRGEWQNPVVVGAKKVEATNIRESILPDDVSTVYFHICIHQRSEADGRIQLSNLHHLAMLTEGLERLISSGEESSDAQRNILNHISVFMIPRSGDYYPFHASDNAIDAETYEVVSQYSF